MGVWENAQFPFLRFSFPLVQTEGPFLLVGGGAEHLRWPRRWSSRGPQLQAFPAASCTLTQPHLYVLATLHPRSQCVLRK